jgi:hypothetical protein
VHPNQVAIDYIWKRFVETTISETAFAMEEGTANSEEVI